MGNANKLNAVEFAVLCVSSAFVGEEKKQETLHFSLHSCMEYNILFVGCSVSEVCFKLILYVVFELCQDGILATNSASLNTELTCMEN